MLGAEFISVAPSHFCSPTGPHLTKEGLRPPDPPKGAPRPWLQRLVAFLARAACPWQLRCRGQNSLPEILLVFEQATSPGQLRCLEQNFLSETLILSKETTCPGQLRCQGQICSPKSNFVLKKPLVWGSCAAWGRTFPRNLTSHLRNHLSGATALPGSELFSEG